LEFSKICVLGLGYIGLPTASTFATHGLQVVGVDINTKVLETLRSGELHIHEPGLRTLVSAALGSGNLTISDTPEAADAFIIAVPTPFDNDKHADLSAVKAAGRAIVPHLQPSNLVVLESTSPPRTTRDVLAPILEESGLKAGTDFLLAYSPERVLPGKILHELIENARVVGGIDRASTEAGRKLYQTFVRGEIVLSDATTAEMVKLMENTYRDVNIAVANEFARLGERFEINIWEAIEIANRHPRVAILQPGPGVGGHCIGVDPWFLVESAPDVTQLVKAARQVNDSQPGHVVNLVKNALGAPNSLARRKIAILGLSYKANVDDLRESPAIEVAQLLMEAGAQVRAYEPYKLDAPIPGVRTTTSIAEAVEDAELLLMLVKHKAFMELNPNELAEQTPARIAVDTVNAWPSLLWHAAGFKIYKLGVGSRNNG